MPAQSEAVAANQAELVNRLIVEAKIEAKALGPDGEAVVTALETARKRLLNRFPTE